MLWAIVKWSLDNHGNYESFMLRGGKSYNWDRISQVLGPVRLLFKDLFKTAMKSLFWIRYGCLFFPFCSVQLEARFPIAMTVMFLLLFSSHIAIITKNSEKREEEKKKKPTWCIFLSGSSWAPSVLSGRKTSVYWVLSSSSGLQVIFVKRKISSKQNFKRRIMLFSARNERWLFHLKASSLRCLFHLKASSPSLLKK